MTSTAVGWWLGCTLAAMATGARPRRSKGPRYEEAEGDVAPTDLRVFVSVFELAGIRVRGLRQK